MIEAVDLFCGVGGVTHGFMKEGIIVKAGIDLDKTCRFAFEKNNKVPFIEKDIRLLEAKDIKSFFSKGRYRVLVGCAPCQTFSRHTLKIKNRNKDIKWNLISEFARLIIGVKPDIVSMENVPDLSKQEVFHDFIKDLERSGYFVTWEIVFCPDYGIPQNRKRLVLLASKFSPITLIPKTHLPSKYIVVEDVLKNLPSLRHGERSLKDPLHISYALSAINLKRIQSSKPSGSWLDWPESLRLDCHKRKTGSTYTTVYGRMGWGNPSPTITTQFYSYGTGRFGHPTQDRAISLREGAILQTFPKYYKFINPEEKFSFKTIGRHIGNAVPVKLAQVIAKSIKEHLKNR